MTDGKSNDEKLMWKVRGTKKLLHTPVFDLEERDSVSASGIEGKYVAMSAPHWVVTIPVYGDFFVLVRQYRHGYGGITTEFPGGMADENEAPEECSRRELLEETGFRAGSIRVLGTCSPNPALFSNRFTVCLAEDLEPTNSQALDDDEVLTYQTVPIDEVIRSFCSGEYVHAFMGTALSLYMREKWVK